MFFFHTNLYAALIAVVCAALTSDTFSLDLDYGIYGFIFSASFFVYNFDRLKLFSVSDRLNSPERSAFVSGHKKIAIFLTSAGFISGLYFFILLNKVSMLVSAVIGIVTMLYLLMQAGSGKSFHHLRSAAKPVLLALSWTLTTVYLPVLYSGRSVDGSIILFSVSLFILFMTAGLWFDFKDRKGDLKANKSNPANIISEKYYLLIVFFIASFNLLFTSFFVKSLPLAFLCAYYFFHSVFYKELNILTTADEKLYLIFIDLPLLIIPASTLFADLPVVKFLG